VVRILTLVAIAASTCLTTSCGDEGDARTAGGETSTSGWRGDFANGVRTGDLRAIQATLADDVELFSPVLDEPFVGRDQVGRLFGVLLDTFEGIEILDEAESPDRFVLFFEAHVGGKPIQIVDILTFSEEGLVDRFVVTARPLESVQALAAAMAPRLGEIL
jgi:ketosteroid isomerase-like protein